jgi:kinetochore protein Spc7/SPC105
MKVNARGKAKSEWYDWKLKWIQGLNQAAEENFAKLESVSTPVLLLRSELRACVLGRPSS